jgi:hypothetical protein
MLWQFAACPARYTHPPLPVSKAECPPCALSPSCSTPSCVLGPSIWSACDLSPLSRPNTGRFYRRKRSGIFLSLIFLSENENVDPQMTQIFADSEEDACGRTESRRGSRRSHSTTVRSVALGHVACQYCLNLRRSVSSADLCLRLPRGSAESTTEQGADNGTGWPRSLLLLTSTAPVQFACFHK